MNRRIFQVMVSGLFVFILLWLGINLVYRSTQTDYHKPISCKDIIFVDQGVAQQSCREGNISQFISSERGDGWQIIVGNEPETYQNMSSISVSVDNQRIDNIESGYGCHLQSNGLLITLGSEAIYLLFPKDEWKDCSSAIFGRENLEIEIEGLWTLTLSG